MKENEIEMSKVFYFYFFFKGKAGLNLGGVQLVFS